MKKLLILLFSILISFNSYGEWMKVGESNLGDNYYLDYSSTKEHNGYVYWWYLNDYLEPTETGRLSSKNYLKSNCNTNQTSRLTYIFYDQSMGDGPGDTSSPTNPTVEYPAPDSVLAYLLRQICDYVN